MTIRHQQIHSMPTTACTQQCPKFEVWIVVDDAGLQFLRDTFDREIRKNHYLRASASSSKDAVSNAYHDASSRRSSSWKCCLNLTTAKAAFSAFSSAICACRRYSSSFVSPVGR